MEKISTLRERIARLEEKGLGMDKALELADARLKAWQESSNEWRKENIDQRALFITREKAESLFNEVNLRLSILEKNKVSTGGEKIAYHNVWVILVAVISFLISLSVLIVMIVK